MYTLCERKSVGVHEVQLRVVAIEAIDVELDVLDTVQVGSDEAVGALVTGVTSDLVLDNDPC